MVLYSQKKEIFRKKRCNLFHVRRILCWETKFSPLRTFRGTFFQKMRLNIIGRDSLSRQHLKGGMNMKKFKRTAALVLALLMLMIPLTACGNDPGGTGDSGKPGSAGKNEDPRPEFVYVPEYHYVKSDLSPESIYNAVYHDGKIYAMCSLRGEEITQVDEYSGETWSYYEYRNTIVTCNIDGTDFAELPDYTPIVEESEYGGSSTSNFQIDAQGNLWLMEYVYEQTFELPEDFNEETDDPWMYPSSYTESYYLRKLSPTGAELELFDLSFLKGEDEDYFYVGGMCLDGAGNIYLTIDTVLIVLDGSCSELFRLEAPNWIQDLQRLKDGSVGVVAPTEDYSKNVIMSVDLEAKAFGEDTPEMPVNAWNYMDGNGMYDFYYTTGTDLFGYDVATGESQSVLNWIDCDLNSDDLSVRLAVDDSTVVCTTYSNGDGEMEFIILKKTPSSQVPQKTILTFACVNMDWNMRREIIEFNKTNDTYRIQVKDYSQYNTSEDYTLGQTKLNTEIIAGNVPDIFDINGLTIDLYASKGLLENLWPWIDADEGIGGRDALVESVFNAMCDSNGNLYQITPSFSIRTLVGHPSIVGDEPGWTLSQLRDAFSRMPQGAEIFYQGMTKADVFQNCLYTSVGEMVDWETGQCYFDSPEFIDLLKFTDYFPIEFDWDNFNYETDYDDEYVRIRDGRQMLASVYFSGMDSIFSYKALFNNEFTFIGYPTQEGNGAAFAINGGLAMSAACENKEGAWQFMRTMLTEEYQEEYNYWNLSTNKKILYQRLEEQNTPTYETDPVTGVTYEVPIYEMWVQDGTLPVYSLSDQEMEKVYDLIENTDRLFSYNEKLSEIIMEEAQAYFLGVKSAEEVASLIQNRVYIVVNEQK